MNVSLPSALEDFVSSQVRAGEFDDASAVVSEAVRLLREAQERKAADEMARAFEGINAAAAKREPTAKDRELIDGIIKTHRAAKRKR